VPMLAMFPERCPSISFSLKRLFPAMPTNYFSVPLVRVTRKLKQIPSKQTSLLSLRRCPRLTQLPVVLATGAVSSTASCAFPGRASNQGVPTNYMNRSNFIIPTQRSPVRKFIWLFCKFFFFTYLIWPPLCSRDQSSWLQIRSPVFDFGRYQIFWVVGLERGPLSLVSIIEELLERKSSGSGLGKPEYDSWVPPRDTPLCTKVGTNSADKRKSFGRYRSLADLGHRV
jgi:hypothetical protein